MSAPPPRPRRRGSLLLRGIWWRRGISLAMLAAAVVTTGAAALGPVFARAASESTLRDELVAAGWPAGLQFQTSAGRDSIGVPVRDVPTSTAAAPMPGAIRGYPSAIRSIRMPVAGGTSDGGYVMSALASREGFCGHVNVVAGRCPTAADEAMVTRRAEESGYGWKPGADLQFPGAPPLRIVGVFTAKDQQEAYWFGTGYFDAQLGGSKQPDTLDAVLVAPDEFRQLPGSTDVVGYVDYPLDPAQIRLDDVPRLRSDIAGLKAHYADATHLALTTGIIRTLDAAAHQQDLIDAATLLVTLQLCVLGWLVLFQVVTDAAEARGPEIALAKLRGHTALATLATGLAEPVTILVVAIPLGLLLGWAGASAFAATAFVPGTPVLVGWPPFAAIGAAFAGGLAAAGLAARRVLTRPVLEQWRRTTTRPRRTRASLLVDIAIAVLAVGGLVVLRLTASATSGGNVATLLAPGLLVAAVAVIGTRLLPLVVLPALPATRASGRIGMFLAARQVVRRPTALRLAALLAVAVGLATFGVGGESVAAANRVVRAAGEIGADRSVSIQYEPTVDPVQAVRRADPDGRWAMAAATWLPFGGDSVVGTVLAVDSSRLARVGSPTAGAPPPARLARLISPPAPPLVVRATRLVVHLDATDLTPLRPRVEFDLVATDRTPLAVQAGDLREGRHDYTVDVPCAHGCTLSGLTWNRPPGELDPMSGTVTVGRLSAVRDGTTRTVDAGLDRARYWHGAPSISGSRDRVTVTAAGLRDVFSSTSGGYGGVVQAAQPDPVPVVATPASLTAADVAPDPRRVVDDIAVVQAIKVVATPSVVPVVGRAGLVADLPSLQNALPDFSNEATWSVLLSAEAPPDALQRLRSAGLTVQSSVSMDERVGVFSRQGPALCLLLLLVSAIVGAALAALGTAISIGAAARRRSYEIAALRAIGVGRRPLYRAAVIEQLLLLGAAVVLGVVAGWVAAVVTLPVIPEFATSTPIALGFVPAPGPIAAFTAAFATLVLLTALTAAAVVMRAAAPGRLREAEE